MRLQLATPRVPHPTRLLQLIPCPTQLALRRHQVVLPTLTRLHRGVNGMLLRMLHLSPRHQTSTPLQMTVLGTAARLPMTALLTAARLLMTALLTVARWQMALPLVVAAMRRWPPLLRRCWMATRQSAVMLGANGAPLQEKVTTRGIRKAPRWMKAPMHLLPASLMRGSPPVLRLRPSSAYEASRSGC